MKPTQSNATDPMLNNLYSDLNQFWHGYYFLYGRISKRKVKNYMCLLNILKGRKNFIIKKRENALCANLKYELFFYFYFFKVAFNN